MSMVRITIELTEYVVSRVKSIYIPQIAEAEKAYDPSWGKRIYTHILGKYQTTFESLHEDFFSWQEDFDISTVQYSDGTLKPCGVSLHLEPSKVFPRASGRTSSVVTPYLRGANYYGNSYTLCEVPTDPVWSVLFAEVGAYCDKVMFLKKQQENAATTVRDVMRNNSTLKGALEDWPPLIDLIDEHTKKQHYERKERAKPAPKAAVDTSNLTGVTVQLTVNKLVGNKNE